MPATLICRGFPALVFVMLMCFERLECDCRQIGTESLGTKTVTVANFFVAPKHMLQILLPLLYFVLLKLFARRRM